MPTCRGRRRTRRNGAIANGAVGRSRPGPDATRSRVLSPAGKLDTASTATPRRDETEPRPRYATRRVGPRGRRLAYADPPYPGNAHYYRGHPDYRGEVDHAELLSRLATYDGWALSTSARALPAVLALAVAQDLPVRVAAWNRGARPRATAPYALNAWEPVIYVPVPSRDAGPARRVDVLTHGVAVMRTLPSRVIGAKPAAFCRWMFDLVGATADDTLDDLYPGSGIVGQAWRAYVSPRAGRDG
jgi:hypothetical protein